MISSAHIFKLPCYWASIHHRPPVQGAMCFLSSHLCVQYMNKMLEKKTDLEDKVFPGCLDDDEEEEDDAIPQRHVPSDQQQRGNEEQIHNML